MASHKSGRYIPYTGDHDTIKYHELQIDNPQHIPYLFVIDNIDQLRSWTPVMRHITKMRSNNIIGVQCPEDVVPYAYGCPYVHQVNNKDIEWKLVLKDRSDWKHWNDILDMVEIEPRTLEFGRKKILFITGGIFIGGTEVLQKILADELKDKYEIHVMSFAWDIDQLHNFENTFHRILLVKKPIEDYSLYSLIHWHAWGGNSPPWLLESQIVSVPIVETMHGSNRGHIAPGRGVVVYVSDKVFADVTVGSPEPNELVISDGINVKFIDSVPGRKFQGINFGMTARIDKWKQQWMLMDVLNKIKDLDFTCHLIGPDPYGHAIDVLNRIKDYGLDHRVIWYGGLDYGTTLSIMKGMTFGVHTAVAESFGLTSAEFMSMKIPVVINNSCNKYITEDNGWVFRNEKELENILRELITNPTKIDAKRGPARKLITDYYDIRYAVEKYLTLYTEMM